MPTVTVRGGFDTFAGEGAPAKTHGGNDYLRLSAASGSTSYAYVYLKNPAPRGATIVSATLRLRVRGNWGTGTKTITARRVADSWKASKLNWNNKPGVTGSAKSAAVVDGSGGDAIDIDVTQHLQTVVNGSAHYGWRIETDSTDADRIHGFGGGDYRSVLVVVWSDKPSEPTSLSPAGGAVSVAAPVLQFDYGDTDGDDLVALKVQVDPSANGSSPAFDSGWVTTTEPELDLSGTAYAGLADGASTQWRVMVRNSDGVESDWSDWVTFSRDAKGTLTITNPAADPNDYVTEPTPPIIWSLTGETQAAYQVRITDADDRTKIRYDSEKVKSTEMSHTLPKKWEGRRVLRDDRTYAVNVRVWDDKDRVATPGDPRYVSEWRDFTMNKTAVTTVDTLTAAQEGGTPWVALTWTRGTAPDSWVIVRDGDVIESDLEPVDTLTSGTTHTWRDWEAKPFESHTYVVRAVVNGEQSEDGPTATVTTQPEGVWVIDFDRDLSFALAGVDVSGWRMTDQGITYRPLGRPVAVRITTTQHGLEGSFTGELEAAEGRSLASFENHLFKIKERPDETYQLVAADLSIPVKLANLSIGPHPDTMPDQLMKLVSFDFYQAGDLPFESRI